MKSGVQAVVSGVFQRDFGRPRDGGFLSLLSGELGSTLSEVSTARRSLHAPFLATGSMYSCGVLSIQGCPVDFY